MDDVRDRLRRASELVTSLDRPFDRMIERRDRKRRSRRLASATFAFAIASAVVGGGVILLSRMGDHVPAAVGTGWRSTKELAMQPGDYLYLRIESSGEEDGHIRDEETWWGIDGSGEVRNRSTRQDKYPYPPSGAYERGEFPIESDVSLLSTDPEVLASQLRQEPWNHSEGEPESERMWDLVSFLLTDVPTSTPELRAALFDVANDIEGVVVMENDLDPVGRPAIGLRFSDEEDGAT
jgi:hypothetical protein